MSTNERRYKAVFFDVGKTLLLPYPSVAEVCSEVLAWHGYDVSPTKLTTALQVADHAYEERYWRDDTFWLSEVDASGFWIELYELMLEHLGINGEAGEIAQNIYQTFGEGHRWRPYDDVLPALKRLSEKNYKIGLISNWDTRLTSLSVETGLADYLDFVISSANVGMLKPQPQIFELALKRAGVEAKDAIHVGDHYYADIMGARTVGITPVLIDRSGKVDAADCLVIHGLHELIDFLESN